MCFLRAIGREPRFLEGVAPPSPELSPPRTDGNTGFLLEPALAEGRPTVLAGGALNLVQDPRLRLYEICGRHVRHVFHPTGKLESVNPFA